MLQRVGVDADHSNGGGPLMVLFVESLIEAGMVEKPERKKMRITMWLLTETLNLTERNVYWNTAAVVKEGLRSFGWIKVIITTHKKSFSQK